MNVEEMYMRRFQLRRAIAVVDDAIATHEAANGTPPADSAMAQYGGRIPDDISAHITRFAEVAGIAPPGKLFVRNKNKSEAQLVRCLLMYSLNHCGMYISLTAISAMLGLKNHASGTYHVRKAEAVMADWRAGKPIAWRWVTPERAREIVDDLTAAGLLS